MDNNRVSTEDKINLKITKKKEKNLVIKSLPTASDTCDLH